MELTKAGIRGFRRAVGYIKAPPEVGPRLWLHLERMVTRTAFRSDLSMHLVYRDNGTPGTWERLLEQLDVNPVQFVLVPSLNHIGLDRQTIRDREKQLADHGTTIRTVSLTAQDVLHDEAREALAAALASIWPDP